MRQDVGMHRQSPPDANSHDKILERNYDINKVKEKSSQMEKEAYGEVDPGRLYRQTVVGS